MVISPGMLLSPISWVGTCFHLSTGDSMAGEADSCSQAPALRIALLLPRSFFLATIKTYFHNHSWRWTVIGEQRYWPGGPLQS